MPIDNSRGNLDQHQHEVIGLRKSGGITFKADQLLYLQQVNEMEKFKWMFASHSHEERRWFCEVYESMHQSVIKKKKTDSRH